MRGEIVWLYAFDVADEVDMAGAESLRGWPAARLSITSDRAGPRDVPLYRPLTASVPEPISMAEGGSARARVKVFDVGVITIEVRAPFDCRSPEALRFAHHPRSQAGDSLDDVARGLCEQLVADLRLRLRRDSPPSEPEAYTVFCVTRLDEGDDVAAWLDAHRRGVAGLLTDSPGESLSEEQMVETLRVRRGFSRGDLVIIEWDAALLVDLTGPVDDVLYVLELANLQCEEFRVIDRRLDEHLDRTYAVLERRPRLMFGQTARVLRTLRRIRLDLSRLTDEVRHITKFLGDWHLARVYDGARERFYLDQWQDSVEDRLHALDDLHREVRDEAADRRMLWLEAAIVVLFVVDIVALFLGKT